MKPAPLTYHAADSVEEALSLLSEHQDEAKVLAGGQSLVPLLSFRLALPEHLVDISRIEELRRITPSDGTIVVGSAVRQAEAEDDPALMSACPLLAAAMPNIAHREIRNAGTVGGSIAHADSAAEIPAVALALDAEMVAVGPRGERTIPADEFFVSYLQTTLEPDELLTAVRLPVVRPGTGTAFAESSRRGGDYAIGGVATTVSLDGERISSAAIACLGVGSTPVRARAAEELLGGAEPGDEAIEAAARVAAEDLDPPSDQHASPGLRRRVIRTLVKRTVERAVERAKEGQG